jgi:site-specific DNA-methyltransferase (adenine-specific)
MGLKEVSIPAGRWPSNLIHDGSDEVLAGFPESGGGKAKPEGVGNGSSMFAGAGRTGFTIGDSGSAARFFYVPKCSKADRDGSPHPTMKPTALMQYLCRLVTPPGGTVLDPFTGSGSTGKAAMLEGFNFIGFEREAEYVEIARRRIAEAAARPMLEGIK